MTGSQPDERDVELLEVDDANGCEVFLCLQEIESSWRIFPNISLTLSPARDRIYFDLN